MARVACTRNDVVIENDRGIEVESVRLECSECDHTTESFGTGENSVRRCLALMREECPLGQTNFYVAG